ncbi:MAG: hypothetical protein ABF290_10345, partial [Thiogranum sp.]
GADVTAEELSGVYAAIAEQVDVVQAGNESERTPAPEPEPATADGEAQNGVVERSGDVATEEAAEVSTASAMQADIDQAANTPSTMISADHEPRTADGEAQAGVEQAGLDQEHRPVVQAEAEADEPDLPDSGDGGTYLFWSPFRSEWAARGFAGRLTLATQVPVEVINAGPAEYRAAFSYRDETERLARIERIETITGLKLE